MVGDIVVHYYSVESDIYQLKESGWDCRGCHFADINGEPGDQCPQSNIHDTPDDGKVIFGDYDICSTDFKNPDGSQKPIIFVKLDKQDIIN